MTNSNLAIIRVDRVGPTDYTRPIAIPLKTTFPKENPQPSCLDCLSSPTKETLADHPLAHIQRRTTTAAILR